MAPPGRSAASMALRRLSSRIWWTCVACLMLVMCAEPPLPKVELTGPAAASLRIESWEQVRTRGVVTAWKARLVRQPGPDPGPIEYTLYTSGDVRVAGDTISYRSAYDYREPFAPGNAFTLTIPAYGAASARDGIQRVRIHVAQPTERGVSASGADDAASR